MRKILVVLMGLLPFVSPVFGQDVRLLAFGDSLTKGFGDPGVRCHRPDDTGGYTVRLPALLARSGWKVEVQSFGVCGELTSEGVSRIEEVLKEVSVEGADLLVLMEGTNDVAQDIGVETILFNLSQIAAKADEEGLATLYVAPIPIAPSRPYDTRELGRRLRAQAGREARTFADVYGAFAQTPNLFSSFYSDPFHPNDAGYDLMATALVEPAGRAVQRLGFRPVGHPIYCRDFGPCGHGEGDCDNDAECAGEAVCTAGAGPDYGFPSNIDVCLDPAILDCPLPNGHPRFCEECGPCRDGEGDCDGVEQCRLGAECAENVGATYGFQPGVDVCVAEAAPPPGECPVPNGHPSFCTQCGPCGDGEGDCDRADECAPGTTCVDNVGASFGFAPGIDVCLATAPPACPHPPGHPRFCTECGPCASGQGDCDRDSECMAGATCVQNVGADYGFPPNIDVCVQ